MGGIFLLVNWRSNALYPPSKVELGYIRKLACYPSSKHHPLFLLYFFGCEIHSLVRGNAVCNSMLDYQSSSCLEFLPQLPQWWTVTCHCKLKWPQSSPALLLVRVFCHNNRGKTRATVLLGVLAQARQEQIQTLDMYSYFKGILRLAFKGLERRLSGWECILLSQRTSVWLLYWVSNNSL